MVEYSEPIRATTPHSIQSLQKKSGAALSVLIAVFLFRFTSAPALGFEVPLVLSEPAGVSRTDELASGAIPLPKGMVSCASVLSLWDENKRLQAQFTPLVTDEQGFIRWVLVDTVTDLPARAEKVFTVKTEAGHPEKLSQLRIDESADTIKVDTGQIRFAISKAKFRLFEYVEVSRTRIAGATDEAMTLIEKENHTHFRSGPPARIEWEYRGPVRATLFLRGPYVDSEGTPFPGVNYTLRVTTWANSSRIVIEHEIGNSNPRQEQYIWLERADVRIAMKSSSIVSSGEAWAEMKDRDGREVLALVRHEGFFDEKRSHQLGLPLVSTEDQFATIHVIPRWDPAAGVKKAPFGYGAKGGYWIFDLTHKGTKIVLDFSKGSPAAKANACNARLHLRAPGEWYANKDGMGIGHFGTVEDESETYRKWGWSGWDDDKRRQDSTKSKWKEFWPSATVGCANIHDTTEADESRSMIQQYLRTGSRGYFDWAEAWIRYQKTHYAYRTDDFDYAGGGTHFNEWHPGPERALSKEALKERAKLGLWSCRGKALQGKYESCHAYAEGLINWYLLTGDRSSLEAAEDIGEVVEHEPCGGAGKPGKARPTRWSTRAFGRQLGIACRLYGATHKARWRKLMERMGRIALQCPDLDERGFFEVWNRNARPYWYLKACKDLIAGKSNGSSKFTLDQAKYVLSTGVHLDPDAPEAGWIVSPEGQKWRGKWFGGTWMATYISASLQEYLDYTGDEDARDLLIAFARFAERYLLYRPCGYIPYELHLDFPLKDDALYIEGPVNWTPEHCGNKPRSGRHQGWYTWHFVDTLVRGYLLTGENDLLETAKILWNNGSKRGYSGKILAADNEVYRFASSNPWNSKDDQASSCTLLFHVAANPRKDREAPERVRDLVVRDIGNQRVEIEFTAPNDKGGSGIAEYQVKYASLPIAAYEDWSYKSDSGSKCNWWYAKNVRGEPKPAAGGTRVKFILEIIPERTWYFAMRSFDGASNRSPISNTVRVTQK